MEKLQPKTHTVDATGKVLGRLAAQIAILLRGKHRPNFSPSSKDGDLVTVKNASKIKITGKKIEQKKYYHHSGYPGGIKEESLKEILIKNPGEVLKKAVWGMLPPNRIRREIIKRLKIES